MQEDWERRHPHVDLDRETLEALLRPAFPGRALVEVEPLSGGLANTNYRALLSGVGSPVVVRIYTRDPTACHREIALHRLVGDRVPVPEVIYADADGTGAAAGYPYMVTRWVEGEKLDALLVGQEVEDLRGLALVVGETLARIGETTFPRAGFFGPELEIAEPLPSIREACVGYVEEALFKRGAAEQIGAELAGRVWRLLSENAGLLDEVDPTARLVHADYKAQNLLVRRDAGGGWAVAAALDWEFALAWTPLLDLAILLRYAERLPADFERGVIEGFSGGGGVLPAEWKRTTTLLDLVNLCEFVARPDPGVHIAEDVRALLAATVDKWHTYVR